MQNLQMESGVARNDLIAENMLGSMLGVPLEIGLPALLSVLRTLAEEVDCKGYGEKGQCVASGEIDQSRPRGTCLRFLKNRH